MKPDAWKQLVASEIAAYRSHYAATGDLFGWFSVPHFDVAARIGTIIQQTCPNAYCLDIGCGAYHRPTYMAPTMRFIGIDPDFGFQVRSFPFCQAIGEHLPFPSRTFDCVTIMSVLDHVLDPQRVLQEAFRVLKHTGYIFVWYRDEPAPTGAHLHSFTVPQMHSALQDTGFSAVTVLTFPANHAKGYPETVLSIAQRM